MEQPASILKTWGEKVMLRLPLITGILSVSIMSLGSSAACAQTYPTKPIRIIVSAPGGGSDFVARLVAGGISGPLGQPVIVDYRGAGILSADYTARALPDGYSLIVSGAILWISTLMLKTPFDAEKDFAPISLLAREVNMVTVHPSLPVKSIKELVDLAKAKPGSINYSSSGVGTTDHLITELFKSMAGINLVHVPYKGTATALTAILGNEAQFNITDVGNVAGHIKAGKLRGLAVTSAQPSALVPGMPTVSASGVPGYEAVGRTGIWAPAKTPAAIISRLNQEIVRAINSAEVKEKFFNAGVEGVGNSSEQFTAEIKNELAKIAKVIKDANIPTQR
jgi:tripartite-type tricarboxylate transporter receptor subunit TctC